MPRFHLRFRIRRDRPLALIYVLTLLTQLGYGMITPFLAVYFGGFVSIELVGVILAGIYAVTVLANIFGASIIERLHERRSLGYALAGASVAIGVLGFVSHISGIIVLFSLYAFLLTLVLFNIDLYVKHYSEQSSLAGNEGKLGVFGNLGWLLGPIIGSAVVVEFGLSATFLACGIATLLGFILFIEARPHDVERVMQPHQSFFASLRSYMKDQELRKLYVVSFGLSFLYAAWNFVPLLLVDRGLSLGSLGIVYGPSALPWVLFEYPVGRLADRKYGEKVFIVTGFGLMVLASFSFSVLASLAWLIGALVLGIIGSSLIERTQAAAFFRRVGDDDVERISVWRTSSGLALILGPLSAAAVSSFVPLPFFFMIVGLLGLLFLATALGLRSSRP